MEKLIMEKQLIAITPEECLGQTIGCMSEVEQPDCYKYYSEQSFNAIILNFTYQKKVGTGHCYVGYNQCGGPYDGLALN